MEGILAKIVGLGCKILLPVLSEIIAIGVIVLGAANIDNCPVEPMIPKYLIGSGALGIATSIVSFCSRLCAKQSDNDKPKPPIPCLVIYVLISIVSTIWLVLGMVWTLRTSPTYTAGSPAYCDWYTYMLAYVCFIILFALILLYVCSGLACCCCLCGTALVVAAVTSNDEETAFDTKSDDSSV